MSTLCCAHMLVESIGGGALSTLRVSVPESTGCEELTAEAATTPEAFTDEDSENDWSFESDIEGSNIARRRSPSRHGHRWPRCADSGKETHLLQQQQQHIQTPQPLRKVRFTLCTKDHPNVTAGNSGEDDRWRAAGGAGGAVMHPTQSAQHQIQAQLQQQQRQRQRSSPSNHQTSKIRASSSSGGGGDSISNSKADSGARRGRTKQIVAAAPFKSTSANISINTSANGSAAAVIATATAVSVAALPVRRTPSVSATPTPASSKKRRLSPLSRQLETCGGCHSNGGRSTGSVSIRGSGGKNIQSGRHSSIGTAPAPAAKTPLPPLAPVDLSCTEELDVDAVMKPTGEVRTPICRFLLPCWPEGVEGYQEVGGWRRVGGPFTREDFPRGRRAI